MLLEMMTYDVIRVVAAQVVGVFGDDSSWWTCVSEGMSYQQTKPLTFRGHQQRENQWTAHSMSLEAAAAAGSNLNSNPFEADGSNLSLKQQ